MTKQQAIKILIDANKWRRGKDMDMPVPRLFGLAIDYAVKYMQKKDKTK